MESNMKSLTALSQLEGRVYIRLCTAELANQFAQQAESEGLTFSDGANPTSREMGTIMAINPNHTINYVGICGMIAYGSEAKTVGGRPLIRITFGGNQ